MASKMLIHWPSPEGAEDGDVQVYRAGALREIRAMGGKTQEDVSKDRRNRKR